MDNPLNNVKQAAQNIRLSHDEKAIMRAKIFETIDAAKYAPAPSSYVLFSFSLRSVVALSLVLVVLVGSGTAYAAQGALPGGALYPVKIYVNEAVAEVLAVSDEAKLSLHTSLAQERLEEAETLAAEGRLDATVTAQIETNFEGHVAEADKLAQALEERDPGAGVEAKITLDSSLSAHGSILAHIGRESDNDATKENLDSFASRVGSRDSAGGVRAAVVLKVAAPMANTQTMSLSAPDTSLTEEATTTAASSTAQKKIAVQLQKKAAADLSRARDAYAEAQSAFDVTTSAKVEFQLSQLEDRFEQGDSELEVGAYAEARDSFTAVLRGSLELKALIEASVKFDADFVRPWEGGGERNLTGAVARPPSGLKYSDFDFDLSSNPLAIKTSF